MEKKRREKEEGKKKKRRRRNLGMETIRVWNCMEFLFGSLEIVWITCMEIP